MRIIAGQFRSRHLKASPPPGTRPTSDKLRETLFNILGGSVRGCNFLDGCAGVGAIGIEAISRGAQTVFFVDQSRKAGRMIRENLQSLGIEDGVRIFEMDLVKALGRCDQESIRFDVAFIDPPYDRLDLYTGTLDEFARLPLLASEGILIFEHSRRANMPDRAASLEKYRTVLQGDSALSFYRMVQL